MREALKKSKVEVERRERERENARITTIFFFSVLHNLKQHFEGRPSDMTAPTHLFSSLCPSPRALDCTGKEGESVV
jgi:hypothetical protein